MPKPKPDGGMNGDKEYVRLRGRLRINDPAEKERRRQEFEAYQRKRRIEEAKAILAAAEVEERAS